MTTIKDSGPRTRFVRTNFVNRPLDEALDELSELTGIAITLDPRVGAKARTPVTARFPSETNLTQVVRLLADMADLRTVVVDTMLYVTERDNEVQFPREPFGPGKMAVPDGFAVATP